MENAAKRLSPHEWWSVYGSHMVPLANIAMKLLAQVPSASACERNWSSYKFIHSPRRNKQGKKRSRDLVCVFQNMRAVKRAREAGIDLCEMLLTAVRMWKVQTVVQTVGLSQYSDAERVCMLACVSVAVDSQGRGRNAHCKT